MKRLIFAVLLSAAPAFADRYDRPADRDDDGYTQNQQDWSGDWDDEQYDWAPSDGSEGNWQPGDDGVYESETYADDRGPTLDDFRNDRELSWNGEWIETAEYGPVWRPTHVRGEWQPYLNGRWVWTRAGWAWASDEPFGWAVYHYGRWAWAPELGWMWVPGRIWAPAWVSWRWSDGYAAWCPLGPRHVVYDRPTLWVVVPSRHFLEPVRHYVVPRRERRTLPLPARPGPRSGPAIQVVERVVGRPVRPIAIGNANTPGSARAGSGSIDFYRPRTAPIPRVIAPGQPPRSVGQFPRANPVQQPPRSVGDVPRPQPQQPHSVGDAPRAMPPPAAQQRPPSVGDGPRAVTPPAAQQRPRSVGDAPRAVTPAPAQPHSVGDAPRAAQSGAGAPRAQPQGPRAVPPQPQEAPHAVAPKSVGEQAQAKDR